MFQLYENIRKRRIDLGMTQSELAEKLGYADKSMIAKIEKGLVDISRSKIFEFAKALNVKAPDLMGYEESSEEEIESLADLAIDSELLSYIEKLKSMEIADREKVFSYIDFIIQKKSQC